MIKETTNIRGQIVVFIGFNVAVRAKCDSGNTPYKPAHPPPNTYNISPTIPIYLYMDFRRIVQKKLGEIPD